ncbi:MAG: excinuclease ABC subunit UvrC [Bacteroidota bacterium]|nr:excinuclease ABC subunit UvrC [Bacteroidota bacterium]
MLRALDNLPAAPGVYRFRDAEGTVIYVGKARNLRSRVRSYFQEKSPPDPKREVMVSKIASFDVIVTDSEAEAVLLENNLIKEHAPRYNIRLKDDKSYPSIVVTNEPFPRVFPTRKITRDGSRYYGPYADVKAMHLMLRTIRSMFPIRSCDYRLDEETIARGKVRLCLDYHIKKCEGPCEGLVSHEAYQDMIRQVEQLLKGKTRSLQALLEERMEKASEALQFETAAALRNRLLALRRYQERQKVASADFADRDIAAVARTGGDAVGVLFRVREGKVVGKHQYFIAGAEIETEEEILEHFLQRYYQSTDDIPPEVLVPAELETASAIEEWLKDRSGSPVTVTAPKIGDKAKLVRMCAANARFVLDGMLVERQATAESIPKSVLALQKDLRLARPPRRVECFDISHFQGAETVASMVSFLDGKPRRSEYRKYRIGSVEGVDDFASLREVVRRRYTRVLDEGRQMPDLIIVDGGKGQLSSATAVLTELGLSQQPIIGIAKRLEEVFVPGESYPLNIPKSSSGLRLLQRIRDEAHRFAVTYHRLRMTKAVLQTLLEEIEGVGPKRAHDLLEKLGSVKAVREADTETLAAVVGWSAARNIRSFFEEETARPSEASGSEPAVPPGGEEAA